MQDRKARLDSAEIELEEKLVSLDRVTKVVKGGKHLRFRALMVVGDSNGHVGFALAKAGGVPDATRKASAIAKKRLIEVPVTKGTIPHEILAKFGASKVLLKPAAPGTGLIASNTVRAVLELAGVRDILSKSLGSSNRVNVVKCTILGLTNLRETEKQETEAETEPQGSRTNETE
ncbi:MAG: 30S ribosomal protein S5 [Dehalococcoidia bacterium]|nr:30S ribosomal protein S5 [Dehalococcoidia bacterium]